MSEIERLEPVPVVASLRPVPVRVPLRVFWRQRWPLALAWTCAALAAGWLIGCGSVTPAALELDAGVYSDGRGGAEEDAADTADRPSPDGADLDAGFDSRPPTQVDAAAEAPPVYCSPGQDGGAVCGSNCDVTACQGGGARQFSCGRNAAGFECIACAGPSPFCWSVVDKAARTNVVQACALDECR